MELSESVVSYASPENMNTLDSIVGKELEKTKSSSLGCDVNRAAPHQIPAPGGAIVPHGQPAPLCRAATALRVDRETLHLRGDRVTW